MTYERSKFGDRRRDMGIPRIPFKDSTGATIRVCRRRTKDRRIGSIQAELVEKYNGDSRAYSRAWPFRYARTG